jgi:hypothetical protein
MNAMAWGSEQGHRQGKTVVFRRIVPLGASVIRAPMLQDQLVPAAGAADVVVTTVWTVREAHFGTSTIATALCAPSLWARVAP